MKKLILYSCLMGMFAVVFSQEEKEYTDEELTKYAGVMVWAEMEKDRMTDVYNDWINKNENLDAPKFLKIKEAEGDTIALQELEATDIEKAAYDKIITDYDSMTSAFKEVYVGKIKEDIGAGLYNSLKTDFKDNADLKSRYDEIVAALKKEYASKEEKSEE
ncbi:MAG: hypothetical protein AAGI25_20685 [Bacteroidota bacterium]